MKSFTEREPITADITDRLGLFFGTSACVWSRFQSEYELAMIDYLSINNVEKESK